MTNIKVTLLVYMNDLSLGYGYLTSQTKASTESAQT